jgi:hypothetical protein
VSERATEESFAVGGAVNGNSILVTGREGRILITWLK